MEQIYKTLAELVAESIEDYEVRAQLALKRIGRMRYNLQFADRELYNDMYETIEEYINENDLDITMEDIDIEEVFFTI